MSNVIRCLIETLKIALKFLGLVSVDAFSKI